MTEGVRRLLLVAAMAGIALVAGVRAAGQLKRPGALTARGERLWLGWAYRDPVLLSRLETMETRLRPGESFCLDADPARTDPAWLQAMTNYAFWRETPAGPCPAKGSGAGTVRVTVSRDGRVEVLRGGAR